MASALDTEIFDTENFVRRYEQAIPSLRYVVLDENTLAQGLYNKFLQGNRNDDGTYDNTSLFFSKACDEGDVIDRFVSHCWQDDPIVKFEALMKFSQKFQQEHGRLPRLWIDMFCIDQDPSSVEINIKCF